jgi:NAD(P)-dependent dehydrogenase (short-subunit alcohol dehydrogenase family)
MSRSRGGEDGFSRGDPKGVTRMRIDGRVALVTGANRGVGAALVDALIARGASRVYAAAREPASVAPVQHRHGERVVPVRLDVTRDEERRAVAAACPDVEILVSNAGLAPYGPVLDTDEAVCRETFEVNVFGPLALVREFAPMLRAGQGAVLFINSLTGLIVSRSAPVYGASKAAMRMLALGLREQLRTDGVVVTTSHPGFIDTDMAADVPFPKATPQQVAERSLDALQAEATVVFPDQFAELVEQALGTRMPEILQQPQQVMTALVDDLQRSTQAQH